MAQSRSPKTPPKSRSARSTTTRASRTAPAKKPVQAAQLSWKDRLKARIMRISLRRKAFLGRRPHRTFRRTRRRDFERRLTLPGYSSFTMQVVGELKKHRNTFVLLVVAYAFLMIVLGGVTSQESYTQVSSLLKESSSTLAEGGWDTVGQAGLLLVATFASGPADLSTDQQIYLAIVLLFVWLSTVWLLREFKLGRAPRLRDALYNSGAPFLSTFCVLIILVCQLLPVGVVALIYAALSSVGIVGDGFGSMLFWVFAAAVASLVMYWVTSTIIALVVVTLPGMYPMRAMKAAGDLVIGRRLRIMYRILWAIGVILIAWVVVMIPFILLTTWLSSLVAWTENIPLMPIVAALMSSLTTLWLASYVYILYRKVVDDGAAPA